MAQQGITSDIVMWATTPAKPKTTSRTRRPKNDVPIKFPIFDEAKQYTNDTFWQTKLTDASLGKFHKGVTFKDGHLMHKKGHKTTSIAINGNPLEVCHVFIQFMRQIRGADSEAETETRVKIPEGPEIDYDDWKSLTALSQKDLVSVFCTMCNTMFKLSYEETNNLHDIINIGLMLKVFTEKNIKLKDKRIVTIEGLIFDNVNRNFCFINKAKTKVKLPGPPKKKTAKIDTLTKNWEALLEEFAARARRSNLKIVDNTKPINKMISQSGSYIMVTSPTPSSYAETSALT
jgi:hypothetical protein